MDRLVLRIRGDEPYILAVQDIVGSPGFGSFPGRFAGVLERDELEEYISCPDDVPDELMLGDVVISKDKAMEQAEEYGHSFERELIYLFTHSVLHLLGYDHEEPEDKAVMRKREEEIMDWLGIPRMQP